MHLFETTWRQLSPWSPLWLLATIFGNPVYNVLAYFLCTGLGFSFEVGTNTTQVSLGFYILILLIVFLLRYVIYRIVYVVKLKDQMTTLFFLEAFTQRHKFQLISLVTFIMWTNPVEGNIAGFIYFPVTILMSFTVLIVTLNRLYRMGKYLDKLKS